MLNPPFAILVFLILANPCAAADGARNRAADVVVEQGAGAPTIAVRLPVGSLADPAGSEGLALLTARSLSAGSQVRSEPGELRAALGRVAGGAWTSVTPDSTLVVLEDVIDAEGALDLLVEMLALPVFPEGDFLRERTRLARERAEAEDAGARRREAAAALVGPERLATPWSVHAIDREALARFHAERYSAEGAVVALVGGWEPPAERLEAAARRAFDSWTSVAAAEPPRRGDAGGGDDRAGTPAARLLRGTEAAGVAAAFAPQRRPSAAAALLALRIAAADDAHVLGPAETIAGDLVAADHAALIVDVATPNPARAARGLLRRLERLARRPPSPGRLEGARQRLAEAVSESGAAGVAEGAAEASAALGRVDAEAVRDAARVLLEGPRSLVATLPAESSERAWNRAHPDSQAHDATAPLDGAQRDALAAGEEAWAGTLAAHGAEALDGLGAFTWIGEKTAVSDMGSAVIAVERLDVSTGDPPALRYEARRGASEAGRLVAYATRDEGLRLTIMGRTTMGPVERLAWERRRERLVPVLLADSGVAVRRVGGDDESIGLQLLDLDLGLTDAKIDAESGQLRSVSYLNRLPDDIERRVTLVFSDHRPVERSESSSVLLPFTTERSTSGEELAIRAIDRTREWRLHGEPIDPLMIDTDPDDIARAMP